MNNKVYTVREVRANMREILDSAELGNSVHIRRRGAFFELKVDDSPRERQSVYVRKKATFGVGKNMLKDKK